MRVQPRIIHRFLITIASIVLTGTVASAWEAIELPHEREKDGAASYRCRLQVPGRLVVPEGANPRDLWRSSTMLVLADLPAGTEVYLNGERIIQLEKAIATGGSKRFKVPKGILQAKKFNTLVLRLNSGSLKRAPMMMDYFNEIELGPAWEFSTAAPAAADMAAVTAKPAAAFYTEADFRLSVTPLDATVEPIPGKRIAPAPSLEAMQTEKDLQVDLLLNEPEVAQPTHLSFDARGRLWVAQYRQYPYPAGLKMLSRDQYYRSKYDRVPPAPPNHDRGADRISVHEDRDGDGRYETHKVVLDGLNMANAALRGWGGIWVMHTPYLLFYPDADGDDQPDGPPEVRLEGFGLEDTHSVANGLVWGPDGWLYGGQGSTAISRARRPDTDRNGSADAGVYNEGCHVWRYHPRSREFELFADGGGNIFGLSFDGGGRLFIGHNGGSTRGWHLVQGGRYLKQGKNPGKFGPPPNPYSYGDMPMMRSANPISRFSNMSIIARGTALPERLRGQFLCVDPLHHYVVSAQRSPRGSSFQTADTGFPLRSPLINFRPVFLTNSPDGSLAIADFCEEYIAHGQNYQGQIDPHSGRVYRLRGKAEKLEADTNLEKKSDAELIALLDHPNLWHRQTAARLLGQRSDPATVPLLEAAIREGESKHRALGALWALHQGGRLAPAVALQSLRHQQPLLCAWAIRLAGDSGALDSEFFTALLEVAGSESDAEVRCQILSTARRLPVEQGLELARVQKLPAEDVDDPYIPLMLWFLIESHCAEEAGKVIALLEDKSFWARPVFKQHIVGRLMRRFAEGGTRADFLNCARLLNLAPDAGSKTALLAGFERAFEGRIPPELPDELVLATGRGSLSMQIRKGEKQALQRGLGLLADTSAGAQGERLQAIRAFGTRPVPAAVDPLLDIATAVKGTTEQRRAALVALQIYKEPKIATRLLGHYKKLTDDLQATSLGLLASRPAWAAEVLRSEEVPGEDLTTELRSRIALHGSAIPAELKNKIALKEGANPAARAEAIRAVLAKKPGDAYRGETIYAQRCAACHRLFFKGGAVGPDLTRYQRDDLGTMLNSILDPNAEIREGYENHVAKTKDGRVLGGFLAESDATRVVLRGFDGTDTTIARDQLKSLEAAGRSLMPEGLLMGLDDQQLRDLFTYLKSPQPIKR